MNLEYSEIIDRLRRVLDKVQELEDAISIDQAKERVAELEKEMGSETFWDSNEKAQAVIEELKRLKSEVEPLVDVRGRAQDSLELAELAKSEGDDATLNDIASELDALDEALSKVELLTILGGKHDPSSAYLSVHAGAGGTESCDWASMMMRMYKRFAERQGFKVEEVDRLDGEEAGIKSVTFLVKGAYAFGYLRSEVGVHRLVRKSPFDAKNKRHTSFSAVSLVPELGDVEKDIEVPTSDLRIDTYRAGGAGGQHVNTTDSAVRITHLPTGIVVQCQSERSQHANRNTCMKVLKARLVLEEERKRDAEVEQAYGEKGEIAWGNQIRNYVLEPYKLVKDRRTGEETGNVDAVLDGEIFPFIEAYLKFRRQKGRESESDD